MGKCRYEWPGRDRWCPSHCSPIIGDGWTPCGASGICPWTHAAVFHARKLLQKSEYLQKVFTLSSPTAWGESKVCSKWIPHVLKDDQAAMRIRLATTHLQCRRNEGNASLHLILTVDGSWMHSFDPQLKRQNAEWRAETPPTKRIARRGQCALKDTHVLFFCRNWLVLDHPVPNGRTVNGQYYWVLLQDKDRRHVPRKQPALLELGCHFAPGHCNTSWLSWCAKSGATLGLEGVGTADLLSRSRLIYYCFFERVKGRLRDEWFESEDDNNTAVTVSVRRLTKDEYSVAVDRLAHRWEKCMNSAGHYTEYRT